MKTFYSTVVCAAMVGAIGCYHPTVSPLDAGMPPSSDVDGSNDEDADLFGYIALKTHRDFSVRAYPFELTGWPLGPALKVSAAYAEPPNVGSATLVDERTVRVKGLQSGKVMVHYQVEGMDERIRAFRVFEPTAVHFNLCNWAVASSSIRVPIEFEGFKGVRCSGDGWYPVQIQPPGAAIIENTQDVSGFMRLQVGNTPFRLFSTIDAVAQPEPPEVKILSASEVASIEFVLPYKIYPFETTRGRVVLVGSEGRVTCSSAKTKITANLLSPYIFLIDESTGLFSKEITTDTGVFRFVVGSEVAFLTAQVIETGFGQIPSKTHKIETVRPKKSGGIGDLD